MRLITENRIVTTITITFCWVLASSIVSTTRIAFCDEAIQGDVGSTDEWLRSTNDCIMASSPVGGINRTMLSPPVTFQVIGFAASSKLLASEFGLDEQQAGLLASRFRTAVQSARDIPETKDLASNAYTNLFTKIDSKLASRIIRTYMRIEGFGIISEVHSLIGLNLDPDEHVAIEKICVNGRKRSMALQQQMLFGSRTKCLVHFGVEASRHSATVNAEILAALKPNTREVFLEWLRSSSVSKEMRLLANQIQMEALTDHSARAGTASQRGAQSGNGRD